MFKRPASLMAIISIALLSSSAVSQAATSVSTFGDMADGLTPQFSSSANFVTIASFILGVGLAFAGLLKMREDNRVPGSGLGASAAALILAGAALVALPMAMSTGLLTFFGSTDGAISSSNSGYLDFQ